MNTHPNEFESFDLIKVTHFLSKYWKTLVICVFVTCFVGFLYVRYTTPEYRSNAKILVKDSDTKAPFSSSELKGLGFLSENIGAESEAEILKSRQLLSRVVDKLDLTTVAYSYGGFTKIKKTELEKTESPIWISLIDDSLGAYFEPISIKVEAKGNTDFKLSFEDGKQVNVKNGDTIEKEGRQLLIQTRSTVGAYKSQVFEFTVLSNDEAITSLQNKIVINRDQIIDGILGISIVGLSSLKNNKIINELIFQQQRIAIDQKNITANKTNDFLTNRLLLIEQKLDSIENIGRSLKSENGIIDITSELPALLSQERELEQELFDLSFNEGVAEQMIDFLNSDEDLQALIPVSLSFKSNSLNIAISEYNQLVLERNRLIASSNEKNPAVIKRKDDIIRLRRNLNKSVQSYLTSIKEQKARVVSKLSSSASKKSSIPKYELDYRDAMRDQKISESIYLLLLQKKEENEIVLASTESNIRVIDYAYSELKPVSPNKKLVYLLAILIGSIFPILFFYLKRIINNKLMSREEVEKLGLPVVGEVPLSKEDVLETVKADSRNPVSEAFIAIRTNIGFMLDRKSTNVIMITSSISGEGKTYVSINLAKSLSATGKKVAVLGLDLRLPKLLEHLDVPYTIGVSNYLSSSEFELEQITYRSETMEGVDFIPCGTIPPNPSELLLRDRLAELMDQLKEKYDVIVVDTSPLGLVADALSVAEYADLLVYVARTNYVKSELLELPQRLYNENKFKSLTMLLNCVENPNAGYGYGYGYMDKKKGGFFSKLGLKRK